MRRCVCRHLEAHHGIAPVLGEVDGRTVVTDWTTSDSRVCVWHDYPELSMNPRTGKSARPCPCTTYREAS